MNIQSTIASAKPAFVVSEAADMKEAVGLMLGGLWWFLMHHTVKTLIVLLIMVGSALTLCAIGYLYSKTDSISIQRAEPLKAGVMPIGSVFGFMPQAYAGEQGRTKRARTDSIWINDSFYGLKDPRFDLYKLDNESAIIIYDKTFKTVLRAEAPVFGENKIEQYKK